MAAATAPAFGAQFTVSLTSSQARREARGRGEGSPVRGWAACQEVSRASVSRDGGSLAPDLPDRRLLLSLDSVVSVVRQAPLSLSWEFHSEIITR